MKKLTFDEFCDYQFLGGEDKQSFKVWLKNQAFDRKYEHEWLNLFTEWLRLNPDRVPL